MRGVCSSAIMAAMPQMARRPVGLAGVPLALLVVLTCPTPSSASPWRTGGYLGDSAAGGPVAGPAPALAPILERPPMADPFVRQGAPLRGREATGEAYFGACVALSADGDTALVGASNADAAFVFTRAGAGWRQAGGELTGSEAPEKFGASVALSAGGDTALVGAPYEGTENGEFAGGAWIFTRSGSGWVRSGPPLQAPPGEEADEGHFGVSVALSADGGTALVGAESDDGERGSAWVFARTASGWMPQARLTGGGESGAGAFGRSVALSADGDTALIGGPNDHRYAGATWVFARTGTSWAQEGPKLVDGAARREAGFGWSVALAGNGDTALITALGSGEALLFRRSGGSWVRRAGLLGRERHSDGSYGYSAALSADGDLALVGAPEQSDHAGAVWAFRRGTRGWMQLGGELTGVGERRRLHFGEGVALSANGDTALVGGHEGHGHPGGAWVFALRGPVG